MKVPILVVVHGPNTAAVPLVLDSPHSGRTLRADFGSVCATTLRRHAGFEVLQVHPMGLLESILAQFGAGAPAPCHPAETST